MNVCFGVLELRAIKLVALYLHVRIALRSIFRFCRDRGASGFAGTKAKGPGVRFECTGFTPAGKSIIRHGSYSSYEPVDQQFLAGPPVNMEHTASDSICLTALHAFLGLRNWIGVA